MSGSSVAFQKRGCACRGGQRGLGLSGSDDSEADVLGRRGLEVDVSGRVFKEEEAAYASGAWGFAGSLAGRCGEGTESIAGYMTVWSIDRDRKSVV